MEGISMKITDNVFKLDSTKGAYAYIIVDNGITFIDTGMSKHGEKILKELKDNKLKYRDIRTILLTHHDVDHIGNVELMANKVKCNIYIDENDLPYAVGQKKRKGLKRLISYIYKCKVPSTTKKLSRYPFNHIDYIHTPGHTPGHNCYVYKNVMFVGDLVREKSGKVLLTPAIWAWNKNELIYSCITLPMDGIQWICPAHGEPFAIDKWNQFIRTLK